MITGEEIKEISDTIEKMSTEGIPPARMIYMGIDGEIYDADLSKELPCEPIWLKDLDD